jgi:hypothetical protein
MALILDRPLLRPDIPPGRYATCVRQALSLVALARRWLLLLLSPLLSAQPRLIAGRRPRRVDLDQAVITKQSWPLRPELQAPLGVCPLSQLAECADGRRRWRLCGDVAVLPCCAVYR